MALQVGHPPQAMSLAHINSYLQAAKLSLLECVPSPARQWLADGLSFASMPTIAYERPATASTPNKPRNWISFRVCINLSQMTSILTHVHAGPTPDAKAEIVWCRITEVHCQVDIHIGTVGWSSGGVDVVVLFQ